MINKKLFYLALSFFMSFEHKAEAQKVMSCRSLFGMSQNETNPIHYTGISLFYSPSLETNGAIRHYDEHVFVQAYEPLSKRLLHQSLRPYFDPVSRLRIPFGQKQGHNIGLEAIYNHYGPEVDRGIVQQVIKAEKSVSLDRQATFIAVNLETNHVHGFIRVFDGSIYQSGIRSETVNRMPLEVILKSMQKRTTIIDEVRSRGDDVFEIGKYYIENALSSHDKKRIKYDVLNWLKDFLESRGMHELENSSYFAHVASQQHKIAYQRFFGFEVVPKEKSENLDTHEDILVIKGIDLLKKIKILQAQAESDLK